MEIEVWAATDAGLKRENNQDSYLVDKELGLYVVADGMGGHRGGEVASAMAVATVKEVVTEVYKLKVKVTPPVLLTKAYEEASRRIFEKSADPASGLSGMGTTLVVALYRHPRLYIANVGDSRAYLMSGFHMWQLTEDHSLVNEQIRSGTLSDPNMKIGRNILTRSVGYEKDVICDITERDLVPGELILMCSDGLSGLVSDERMADICLSVPKAEIVPRCIAEAKANGGDDNITVIAIYAKRK